MLDDPSDPVLVSIEAYNNDPAGYARRYEEHLLDRPHHFMSLLRSGSRILDLGCGPGRDIRIFTQAGHDPVGVELNTSFVTMARQHGEVIEADIRCARDLFAAGTFHGVWAQASLVHLSMDGTKKLLRDIRDLLAPGGVFYACVPAEGRSGWRDEPDGRRWYTVWPGDEFESAVATADFAIDAVVHGPYVEVWATRKEHLSTPSDDRSPRENPTDPSPAG